MLKVVVGASSFGKASSRPLAVLRQHGVEPVLNPYGRKLTEEETLDFLQGADGLLAGLEPLNRRVLSNVKSSLKAVARIGIGMDNIDTEAARECGIAVSNTPDGPTQAVAELTITALLAIYRRLIPANNALHRRRWEKLMGFSVADATVLIIGYGRTGHAVAEILRFLGAEILIYDPFQPDLSLPTLADGLRRANVVSLHAGGQERILGGSELALLPEGAVLLNAARGSLLDEHAVYEALQNGRLSACWCDVHAEEPYTGPLCDCENAILTPHMATYTTRCRLAMEMQAVQNLLRDLHAL